MRAAADLQPIRCPVRKRCAVELIAPIVRPSRIRAGPSHTFTDRPPGSTSHSRANRSALAAVEDVVNSARTGPSTS
jgi:hypothetical protein